MAARREIALSDGPRIVASAIAPWTYGGDGKSYAARICLMLGSSGVQVTLSMTPAEALELAAALVALAESAPSLPLEVLGEDLKPIAPAPGATPVDDTAFENRSYDDGSDREATP